MRGPLALAFAGLLGASAVVLPAVASSEASSTIEAKDTEGPYKEQHHSWKPPAAEVSAGGSVTFSNPNTVNHGVEWVSGPVTPTCSATVPVGTTPASSGHNWSGTCTFAQPGKYTFYCTVHGLEMTGTITVNASGTTPTTTTPTTTGSTTTAGGSAGGGGQGGPSPSGTAGGSSSPLAGSAASALKLAPNQRGGSVRGSVDIAPAGAGGRLEVDLLAKSASLATTGHAARLRVGRLVVSHLHAGRNTFSVRLDNRARRALRRNRRLTLSARMLVSAPRGSALTITRSVLVRS